MPTRTNRAAALQWTCRLLLVALLATPLAAATLPSDDTGPVWTDTDVGDLLRVARSAPAEGLAPRASLIELLERAIDEGENEKRDALAAGAFRELAAAFASVDQPARRSAKGWFIASAEVDIDALMASALALNSIDETLRSLLPDGEEYKSLRAELERVRGETAGTADKNGLARESRIVALRANLERWRWLPRALPSRRIEVRIPEFRLTLFDGNAAIATHAVIVGTVAHKTPTFMASVRSVVFNPWWTPPIGLIAEKLLPRFRRDPGVVTRDGYELQASDGTLVDPDSVDWHAMRAGSLPFVLRQRPGPKNALGIVKLDMPNPHAVYLHDTPSKELFERARRTLSFGCVRVSDAVGLMGEILSTDRSWTKADTDAAFAIGAETRIPLERELAVVALYLTARADETGTVHYFEDVYGRDAVLVAALDAGGVRTESLRAASMAAEPAEMAAMTECGDAE